MTLIDRYEVRKGLARGAMGSVYLAYDPKVGRHVAIKVLQAQFAMSDRHRQRFEREARAIAALKHPNIVEIYDCGNSPDNHIYLVMEYLEGAHLGRLAREVGPFPESVLAACGFELCGALAHAHRAGIIHRDLKPENVFLDKGRLVLVDFGIAKAVQQANPLGAAAANPLTDVIGTPGFMAPEQVEQRTLDARTDLFSLGAMLYYLATQQVPFPATSIYELSKRFRTTKPELLSVLAPKLSAEMCRFVHACIAVEPHRRPKNADAARATLGRILESCGVRDAREVLLQFESDPAGFPALDEARPRPPPSEVFAPPRSRRRWLVAAAAVALAAAAAGAYLFRDEVSRWRLPFGTQARAGQEAVAPSALEPAPAARPAQVRFQAIAGTHVFANGSALGATPLAPLELPSGPTLFELMHERFGRFKTRIDLPQGASVILAVDWKRKDARAQLSTSSE